MENDGVEHNQLLAFGELAQPGASEAPNPTTLFSFKTVITFKHQAAALPSDPPVVIRPYHLLQITFWREARGFLTAFGTGTALQPERRRIGARIKQAQVPGRQAPWGKCFVNSFPGPKPSPITRSPMGYVPAVSWQRAGKQQTHLRATIYLRKNGNGVAVTLTSLRPSKLHETPFLCRWGIGDTSSTTPWELGCGGSSAREGFTSTGLALHQRGLTSFPKNLHRGPE